MGYDDHGHCPMFKDNKCSIYEHRPRTCRAYDCRVFAATDVLPEDPAIAARASRWRFTYGTPAEEQMHAQMKQRASTDTEPNPTKRAVRAVAD